MLLELLGATHSYFQEDLNFTEVFSCLPETASTMTLLHMLEGMPAAAVRPDKAESQPLLQQEPNYQQYSVCHREALAEHELCKRYDMKSASCKPYRLVSCKNLYVDRDPFVQALLQPSSSVTSDPSSTLVSGENYIEAAVQDPQARVMQHSQASLDEGSASASSIHVSSTPAIQDTIQLKTALAAPHESVTSHEHHSPFESEGAARPVKKRKRTRACKNSEEVESQRMTHIAVERNRRKQMNEHLSVLRSLMPASYIQRGDQASIIGGAIEFVRELEQVLQALQLQKQQRDCEDGSLYPRQRGLLGDLLLCQQSASEPNIRYATGSSYETPKHPFVDSMSAVVNVEVKMIGSSAVVKVLAQKKPHQLLNALSAIENLHLKIMHLNITTIEQSVLYSFNVEVEDECQVHCASDIAHSVQSIFRMYS